jgi:sugar lactone lactonase YvrE
MIALANSTDSIRSAAICLIAGLALVPAPSRAALGAEVVDLPPSHGVRPEPYATGIVFAEGPAVDACGNLYVVNLFSKGTIGVIAPDRIGKVLCDLRRIAPVKGRKPQANGIKIDRRGFLVVADFGAGRLLRVAPDGSWLQVLADNFCGKRFGHINDVALDLEGNLFFTDSPFVLPGSVYRYDIKTGRVTELDRGLRFPNGVAVSPDQKHLCVSETLAYRILIYDLSPNGAVSNRRVLINLRDSCGRWLHLTCMPDGMVFDQQSRLYVAMYGGGVINVVDVPSGRLVRQYCSGGSKATNCHFHGGFLYVTVDSAKAVYRLKLGVEGFAYNGVR